jgi:hypothetical protein
VGYRDKVKTTQFLIIGLPLRTLLERQVPGAVGDATIEYRDKVKVFANSTFIVGLPLRTRTVGRGETR